MSSKAEQILDDRGVSNTMPTVAELNNLIPEEWFIVIDAIIDRSFVDDIRRINLEQILNPIVIHQRYYERQTRHMEILPPLLPWFISGRAPLK